jgi:hypothetical protein
MKFEVINKKRRDMAFTKESNKLIADFMGAKYDKDTSFPMHSDDLWLPIHGVCNFNSMNGKCLRYHSSWDWLMPVVEKIEGIEIFRVDDEFVNWKVYINTTMCTISGKKDFVVDSNGCKKTMVYQAVVQFIEWYNEQNR